MATSEQDVQSEGRYVHANDTDIYYVEAGQGEPLLLLHGGVVSTSPVWAGHPWAYVSHMDAFAQHFRVIAPTRTSRLWRTRRVTRSTNLHSRGGSEARALTKMQNAGLRVRGCVEGEQACSSGSQWYRSGWCWSHLARRRDRWETRTPGSPYSRLCRRCLWYRPCRLHSLP
jgi:pimeloyl-ACP methyl ester carboxylesterase